MLRVTADLHLRLDVPQCRTESEEEWLELQRKSLESLCKNPKNHQTLVIAGDIYHRAVSSPRLTNMFISEVEEACIMPGNHDEQMRNPDMSGTSYGILDKYYTPITDVYHTVPYGKEDPEGDGNSEILFIHRLVFPSDSEVPPGSDGVSARNLLKLYPDYKVIVAGDNHSGFIYEHGGRKVLVPGSMTVQSASLAGQQRYFYDIDEETWEITKHPYPDTGENVTREHLVKEEERDERMTAFVEALKKEGDVSFDFESNVLAALNNPEIKDKTKTIVKELLYA